MTVQRLLSSAIAAFVLAQVGAAAGDLEPLHLPHGPTIFGDVYAAHCAGGTDGAPALRLEISGLRDAKGNLRVQLYGGDPDGFLEKGSKLLRIQVPAPAEGEAAAICVPLEHPGTYALLVLHDRDQDGKADVFSEGFGFSNNPKLKLRKPHYDEVAFTLGNEVLDMQIEMQYFGGNNRRRERR